MKQATRNALMQDENDWGEIVLNNGGFTKQHKPKQTKRLLARKDDWK